MAVSINGWSFMQYLPKALLVMPVDINTKYYAVGYFGFLGRPGASYFMRFLCAI